MTDYPDRRPPTGPDPTTEGSLKCPPGHQTSTGQLMTVQETADLLGLTEAQLAQMRAYGSGPTWGTFTTRVVRYDRDEVLSWARTHPQPD